MLAVALIAVLLVLLWAMQRRLIYLPSPGPVAPAQDLLEGATEVTLHTSDGLELGAWFVQGRSPTNGMTVLVANGNAGDRSLRAPLAKALRLEGFAVLLFDYRGYGDNPGDPSEEGLKRDVRAAYSFLTEDQGIRRDSLIYFGESLGAAVVTELAIQHPPAGLVLRSPFSDLAAVGRVHYPFLPVGLLLRDRFPVLERIRKVEVPTTVVWGSRDGIVPPEQSRAVAQAAAGPTAVVELRGVDHNDAALLNGRALINAVVELAERIKRSA